MFSRNEKSRKAKPSKPAVLKSIAVTNPAIIDVALRLGRITNKPPAEIINSMLLNGSGEFIQRLKKETVKLSEGYLQGGVPEAMYRARMGKPPSEELRIKARQNFFERTEREYIIGEIGDSQYVSLMGKRPSSELREQQIRASMLAESVSSYALEGNQIPRPIAEVLFWKAFYSGPAMKCKDDLKDPLGSRFTV